MPGAAAGRESQTIKGIKRVLQRPDVFSWKTHGGGFGTVAGLPDFTVCRRGRFIGIEAKRPNGSHPLTDKQRVVLWKIADAGGIAVVVNDPEQVVALFAYLDANFRDMGARVKGVRDLRDADWPEVSRVAARAETLA